MRTELTRTLFVIGTLVCMTSMAAAAGVEYSNMEHNLPGPRQYQSMVPGVQQVAYLSEINANEEQLPSGSEPMPGQVYEMPQEAYEMSPQYYEPMACCSDQCCCEPYQCCQSYGCCQPQRGMWYSEAQLMFLRAHVAEQSIGKLSETYEFTPRFIVGYESPCGWGARARYWTYGRTTRAVRRFDDDLRLEFDVLDLEGTTRFHSERADLVLSGGFRWLNVDTEYDDESAYSDMPGLTIAADLRTPFCQRCRSEWSGVFGARWSILGGDWKGGDDAFVEPTRDDNLTVQELYGGVEYLCHHCRYDLYARLVFEMQNWHSDAFDESAETDSISFLGPGVHVGATF